MVHPVYKCIEELKKKGISAWNCEYDLLKIGKVYNPKFVRIASFSQKAPTKLFASKL